MAIRSIAYFCTNASVPMGTPSTISPLSSAARPDIQAPGRSRARSSGAVSFLLLHAFSFPRWAPPFPLPLPFLLAPFALPLCSPWQRSGGIPTLPFGCKYFSAPKGSSAPRGGSTCGFWVFPVPVGLCSYARFLRQEPRTTWVLCFTWKQEKRGAHEATKLACNKNKHV